jgi:RNA polymerase sigma-70 factor (ECF subfamily)
VSAAFGDLNAFDELVRRYRYAVMMTALDIVGSREAAEDVAQDVFLLAYKSLPQLGDPTKFAGWLYSIARNRARRVGTQEAARRATPLSAVDEFLLAKSSELGEKRFAAVEQRIVHGELVEELERIPPEYGDVLRLYYAEGWPVERIASFLLLPRSTVKWRLYQGRKLLQRRLGENETTEAPRERRSRK